MQIYIDSANPGEIDKMLSLGIIDGVTTNPTLAVKAGVTYKEAVQKILSMVDDNVSLEVLSTDTEGMIREGRDLAKLGKNVVVKLPTTEEGLKALKVLTSEGIRINMTLVFSANQALLVATCPYDVLEKLVKHPLTAVGLKNFLDDFRQSSQEPLV